jgi:hypothetical protein
MAHYAKLNENNIVEQVIVINNDKELTNGIEDESAGVAFCASLTNHQNWKKTSYNAGYGELKNKMRKQYAGIGFSYDPVKDVFVVPQPYPSWVLDSNSDWQAPTPRPQDGNLYYWDESTLSWNLVPLPESSSDNGA